MPSFRVDVTADPYHPRVVDPHGAPVAAINDFLIAVLKSPKSPSFAGASAVRWAMPCGPRRFHEESDRLLNDVITGRFFQHVVERAQPYMSDEHFTVDGTLFDA